VDWPSKGDIADSERLQHALVEFEKLTHSININQLAVSSTHNHSCCILNVTQYQLGLA